MRAGQILPVADAIDTRRLPRRRPHRQLDLRGDGALPRGEPVEGPRRDPRRASRTRRCAPAPAPTAIVGMNVTPDSIVELWVRTLAKHGIGSLWIFDCLHDVENMIRVAKIARDAGLAPSPQLNFSESPVHTDEYYADVIDRMIAGGAADDDHPRRRGRRARARAGAALDPPDARSARAGDVAARDALPQPHRDGEPQPHHRRRGGGARSSTRRSRPSPTASRCPRPR